MHSWFCRLLIIISILGMGSEGVQAIGSVRGEFYSETVYDSRIQGAVTDSRFYNYWGLLKNRIRPYGGFHFTRDLTNSRAPRAIENAFMPTLGLEVSVLKIPYLSVFSEYRLLYRSEPRPQQRRQAEDLRFGLIFYVDQPLAGHFFAESYGEWVQIDRVSPDAALTGWLKLGRRFAVTKNLKISPYTELFTRQSPDLGYGPTENEWRLGSRLEFSLWGVNGQLLTSYAAQSNIKPGGWDALFVLSKRAF